MSILSAVADKDFKTFFYDSDDSIGMTWKLRYAVILPRHEFMQHFGTVGMAQFAFANVMQINANTLENQGIERAMFEIVTENGHPEFKIIKDSINVNQLEASIKQRNE